MPFYSAGRQKFTAIAKNRIWGNPKLDPDVRKNGAKDFYNDLVSSVLDEALEVETWEDAKGKIPPPLEHGEKHPVENTASVNLAALDFPYAWPESVDHPKLAISDRSNPLRLDRYVCVGDINFTDAQHQRGGGTCASSAPTYGKRSPRCLSKAHPRAKVVAPKTFTKKTPRQERRESTCRRQAKSPGLICSTAGRGALIIRCRRERRIRRGRARCCTSVKCGPRLRSECDESRGDSGASAARGSASEQVECRIGKRVFRQGGSPGAGRWWIPVIPGLPRSRRWHHAPWPRAPGQAPPPTRAGIGSAGDPRRCTPLP